VVNFVECFRQIDCTEINRVTFTHIVANNITHSIYSISATHTFLKAELIISRKQYSNILDKSGLMAIPRKSSHLRALERKS